MEKWPLPEGWAWKQVKTVLKTRSGNVDPRKFPDEVFALYSMPAYDEKMKPMIVPGNEIGSSKREIFAGDCLFSRLNPRIPRVWIVQEHQERAICSTDFVVWIDRKRSGGQLWFEPEYLRYMLLSLGFRSQVKGAVQGATGSRQRIRRTALQEAWLPVPPLEIQRRIVARIEELFAELGAARHLHAALIHDAERLMDAALLAMFEKQDAWQTHKLGDLVTIEASQVDPTLPEYRDLPHINGSTIESVTGQLGEYQTAAEDGMISAKYHFHPGAVLYSKIRPYLRKAATVDFEGVCSADMYPLRVQTDNLSRDFLKWTLLSHPFTEYASELSGRARMPKLNRKQLFAYPIRVPDLTTQRRIVAHLDKVQTHAAEIQHAAAAVAADLDRLEQSILAQAFEGKL